MLLKMLIVMLVVLLVVGFGTAIYAGWLQYDYKRKTGRSLLKDSFPDEDSK